MAREYGSETKNGSFENRIARGVSLVDFNAPWCAPCRIQKPAIEKLAQKYSGRALVFEVNVDEKPRLAVKMGITSIPTLVIFSNGCELKRFIGLQRARDLETALEQALHASGRPGFGPKTRTPS